MWSYVLRKEIGPVVLLEGCLNGTQYQENMLKDVVWPRIKHIPYRNKQFRYMHDGAPCHRAKIALEYLQKRQIQML